MNSRCANSSASWCELVYGNPCSLIVWQAKKLFFQNLCLRVTPPPPCVLRTALFWHCVLRTAIFCLAYCVPFNNKNNLFGRFHLHKEVKITVCCMHMYISSWKHKLLCVCLSKFLDFDLPQSMLKFINAEMTPKKRERSDRATFFRVIWLCYSCVLCCCMKIGPFKSKNWCQRTI